MASILAVDLARPLDPPDGWHLAVFSTRRYSTTRVLSRPVLLPHGGRPRRPGWSRRHRRERPETARAVPAGRQVRAEAPGDRRVRPPALFLEHGYQGTSMDDIAALAAVSKQTVATRTSRTSSSCSATSCSAPRPGRTRSSPRCPGSWPDSDDLAVEPARRWPASTSRSVMQPRLLQMRRLIVSESGRFPDLARAYYERVPEHVMTGLAAQFGDLAARGLLRVDDPAVPPRGHYAFLVLGAAAGPGRCSSAPGTACPTAATGPAGRRGRAGHSSPPTDGGSHLSQPTAATTGRAATVNPWVEAGCQPGVPPVGRRPDQAARRTLAA